MSSCTREARHLQATLAAETGVAVEVAWDRSPASHGWTWHVLWPHGPTERAMRTHVDRITALRAGELHADDLAYLRTVQPRSVALSMVRNVRLGQPPLGRHPSIWELEDELRRTEYPEQGTGQDQLRAAALAQLADHDPAAMAARLLRIGLAGLDEAPTPRSNVISLDARRAAERKNSRIGDGA